MATAPRRVAGQHDLLPEIVDVVRDAIKAKLITSVSLSDFTHNVRTLKDDDLEEYLQTLWDEL